MKKITMFLLPTCPYCVQARKWMDELVSENPAYGDCEIKMIDESAESALADSYDYYYVPTYYVGGVKVHEGAATKEKIKAVYEAALK